MKRWNGWGDETHHHDLPDNAAEFLRARVGTPQKPTDATLAQAVQRVPESRLPHHPAIRNDAEDRLRHARGQSFPDWLALRSGQIDAFPDGIAYPTNADDVRELLRYARENGVKLIPYGGGTSVAGHINPRKDDAPTLSVDMGRMNRLMHFDESTRLATFGAGVVGPDLEAQLRAQGYTLGHYPQSFEYSTLGGWIATRSSGQQSIYYGRIEKLFAGGRVQTPRGELVMPSFPASAAGPDLREMVLGSEGRIGFITEATVRVSPQPERETFRAVFFPDFERGMSAVREIAQAGLPLSMLRLSTAVETETTLALAGKERLIGAVERILSAQGAGEGKAMLMIGYTGKAALLRPVIHTALSIAKKHGGVTGNLGPVPISQSFGKTWQKSRFRTPYLRNRLWEQGFGVDTVETATTWTNTLPLLAAMEGAIKSALTPFNEQIHVFTHLSHLYPTGTSIYTSYVFRLANDPAETFARWQALKGAVSRAIVENGGTISHQHGVGLDHAPYLAAEKGEVGMEAIKAMVGYFDPDGMLNPGKLIENSTGL